MKNATIAIAVGLLAVLAVLLYRGLQESPETVEKPMDSGVKAPGDVVLDVPTHSGDAEMDGNDEAGTDAKPKAGLDGRWWSRQDLIEGSSSEAKNEKERVYTSIASADLKMGETLITGGYRDSDGLYGMCLLTPEIETMEDGSEAIQMNSMLMAVGPEMANAIASSLMASDSGEVIADLQSWIHDLAMGLDQATAGSRKFKIMSMPKVMLDPSQSFAEVELSSDASSFYLGFDVEVRDGGVIGVKSQTEIKFEE